MSGKKAPTQAEHRRSVDVGPGMGQVSSAGYWHKHKHFKSIDEARGAFKLAYQQGMDGMGTSVRAWMGITEAEYSRWMGRGEIPGAALGALPISGADVFERVPERVPVDVHQDAMVAVFELLEEARRKDGAQSPRAKRLEQIREELREIEPWRDSTLAGGEA